MKNLTAAIFGFGLMASSTLLAQGFRPPMKTSTAGAQPSGLVLGERVSDTVTITDLQGVTRTLLSYKSPLDIMVVIFMSARCSDDQALMAKLKHFYDDYKEWGVTFLVIEGNSTESTDELVQMLKKASIPAGTSGLGVPVLSDPKGNLARFFSVKKTPTLVILDESKALRYRGPLENSTRQAIEAVISHQEPVDQPESPVTTGCPVQ